MTVRFVKSIPSKTSFKFVGNGKPSPCSRPSSILTDWSIFWAIRSMHFLTVAASYNHFWLWQIIFGSTTLHGFFSFFVCTHASRQPLKIMLTLFSLVSTLCQCFVSTREVTPWLLLLSFSQLKKEHIQKKHKNVIYRVRSVRMGITLPNSTAVPATC